MVKSPLVIQDYLCPIESTRKQLMEENSSRSKHKKFCFKKYVTEKERIKKYLEERKSFGMMLNEVKTLFNDTYESIIVPEMRRCYMLKILSCHSVCNTVNMFT